MKINKCKYCGDMPKQTTHEGRNRIGRLGFVSVMQCPGCLRRVETFSDTPGRAAEKCAQYWNWGATDKM